MLTAKSMTPLEITLNALKSLENEGKISIVALFKIDADAFPAAVKIPRIVAIGTELRPMELPRNVPS